MAYRRRIRKVFRRIRKGGNFAIKSIRKVVKRVLKRVGETKHIENEIQANFDYADAGLEYSDDMTVGSLDTQRIGDKITPMSLNFKGYIQWNSSATTLVPVRCLTIQQKNDQDTTLGLHQILATTTQAFVTQAPYLWDNRKLFTVLSDKIYNPPMVPVGRTVQKSITVRCKKPAPIHFRNGTNDTVSGKIVQYYISNQSDSNNIPLFLGNNTFTYKDV